MMRFETHDGTTARFLPRMQAVTNWRTNMNMTMNMTNATNTTTALATDDDLALVPWVLNEVCEEVPEILLRPGTFCEPTLRDGTESEISHTFPVPAMCRRNSRVDRQPDEPADPRALQQQALGCAIRFQNA